jgi:CDP-paratose 2-epimerase
MPHLLVTGGAGFIGSHTVRRFLDRGWTVTGYDNLSRVGSELNLNWINSHPASGNFTFIQADVRDYDALVPHVARADAVLHAAGQTAVTKSVLNPRNDFEDNMVGTFNLLEAARETLTETHNPVILYTSTNKVYGEMEHIGTSLVDDHYRYIAPEGVSKISRSIFIPLTGAQKARAINMHATMREYMACGQWSCANRVSTEYGSLELKIRAGWPTLR